MKIVPEGHKLVLLKRPDGTESVVLIEDEFMARVRQLADDRVIELREPAQ